MITNTSRLPTDCVLAVTYRCNSRCSMCDIWKIKDFPEIPFAYYSKLPDSLRDINLSGGEPFLRMDLPDIVRTIISTCPKARVVISSNGFATELIVKQMKEILEISPKIGVAVSIDGIGEMHDELRGIEDGFELAINTVRELKNLGMTNLRLAYTMMAKNLSHMSKVYDLSRKLGVEFTHSYAQSSDFYFGGKQNNNNDLRRDLIEKEYNYIIREELKSWKFKRWARAYFAFGMKKFVSGKEQMLINSPGRDFFFVDPGGNIYPSVVHNVMFGNLKNIKDKKLKNKTIENGFLSFWFSAVVEEKRKQVDALKIPVWMICTARTAIKKSPLRAAWWFLRWKTL